MSLISSQLLLVNPFLSTAYVIICVWCSYQITLVQQSLPLAISFTLGSHQCIIYMRNLNLAIATYSILQISQELAAQLYSAIFPLILTPELSRLTGIYDFLDYNCVTTVAHQSHEASAYVYILFLHLGTVDVPNGVLFLVCF